MVFVFSADDRKQLAKLRAGQNVSIEGETRPIDQMTLQFVKCRIVKPKVEN
jgi:hypothetical protein